MSLCGVFFSFFSIAKQPLTCYDQPKLNICFPFNTRRSWLWASNCSSEQTTGSGQSDALSADDCHGVKPNPEMLRTLVEVQQEANRNRRFSVSKHSKPTLWSNGGTPEKSAQLYGELEMNSITADWVWIAVDWAWIYRAPPEHKRTLIKVQGSIL